MPSRIPFAARIAATTLVVGVAAGLLLNEYKAYLLNPWTRDGIVQSRVVLIAPRVSGIIEKVHVSDNALVRTGERLFTLDAIQSELALPAARTETNRLRKLAETAGRKARQAVGTAEGKKAVPAAESAKTNREAAQDTMRAAQEKVETVIVAAPETGYVTGLAVSRGDFAEQGHPLVALIARDAFHVNAFFRETVIAHIRPGMRAMVTLAAYPDTIIEGTVESIGFGIARTDGSLSSPSEGMLPEVMPAFEWIRLAQRIPVRICFQHVPDNVILRVGLSASVMVLSGENGWSITHLFSMLR